MLTLQGRNTSPLLASFCKATFTQDISLLNDAVKTTTKSIKEATIMSMKKNLFVMMSQYGELLNRVGG